MGDRRRLTRWVEAGLLDEQQAARILEFERSQARPLLLYAIAGLGALAIAVGIISIVAANWDLVPGRVKIASDLLLLTAGGILLAWRGGRWPDWVHDAVVVVLYGLTLASIALVGQEYQLGGTERDAMLAWSALTLPLMALGRTGFLAALWTCGLQGTIAVWLIWIGDFTPLHDGAALAGAGVVPWFWLLMGYSARLKQVRPAFAQVFLAIGTAELLLCASIGASAFYEDTRHEYWGALWVGLLVGGVCLAWLWRRIGASSGTKAWCWALLAMLLLTFVPARLSPGDWDLLAALLFIGLWLLVAWAAHRTAKVGLLNFATAVVGLRIVIVYFEVFGSLLDTGLGLVSGGLLTLLILWLWWRKRRDFRAEFSGTEVRS